MQMEALSTQDYGNTVFAEQGVRVFFRGDRIEYAGAAVTLEPGQIIRLARGVANHAFHKVRVGTKVRIKDKPELGSASVESLYGDSCGGVRLDKKLDGFWSWNVEELEIVR